MKIFAFMAIVLISSASFAGSKTQKMKISDLLGKSFYSAKCDDDIYEQVVVEPFLFTDKEFGLSFGLKEIKRLVAGKYNVHFGNFERINQPAIHLDVNGVVCVAPVKGSLTYVTKMSETEINFEAWGFIFGYGHQSSKRRLRTTTNGFRIDDLEQGEKSFCEYLPYSY
ncbi:MAG: hypothetical protein IT289_07695 [Oligoflexia bacterium]|nr:hypothetical protein [Oligoflexia bacterium]